MTEIKLVVYNNAHYMDESEAYTLRGFASYAAALLKAQTIVREDLEELCKPGMDSAALLSAYKMFGNDPVILPSRDRDEAFSAWQYAALVAAEVCAAKGQQPVIPVQVLGQENRVNDVLFCQETYHQNPGRFLKNLILALHYLGRKCDPNFEVPLADFLHTGQLHWYARHTDIGGYHDYSLYRQLAYIPGNYFSGILISVCESTGYNSSESCVEIRALGLHDHRYAYVTAELDTGIGGLAFSGPAADMNLHDLLQVAAGGQLTLQEKAIEKAPEISAKPNDFFRHEPGYHVVIFQNSQYRDFRYASCLKGLESLDAARQKACAIVENSVSECHRTHFKTPDEHFQLYTRQGLCPVIFSQTGEVDFDAWAYAKCCCEQVI